MAISEKLIRDAIEALSDVDGIIMNPAALVEDVVLLARSFPTRTDFMTVCANTRNAFAQLVADTVDTSPLKYELEGWRSYRYQSRVAQGAKADCRILFRRQGDTTEVKGFGHMRIPADFYIRMSKLRDAKYLRRGATN